jgi:hypothetical protein
MATTTNYGWTTPDDTALVKDGAAAIRTLGSSVDTTTKNLNPSTTLGDIEYRSSTANTNTRLPIGSSGQFLSVVGGVPAWAALTDQTPLTTKGDLFTFSTIDARLGVGANNTILTADSAEATGLKWATPAAGGMTLISETSASALSSLSFTSIAGTYKQLLLIYSGIRHSSNSNSFGIRLNNNSSNVYPNAGLTVSGSTVSISGNNPDNLGSGSPTAMFAFGKGTNNAATSTDVSGYILIDNYASSTKAKSIVVQFQYYDNANGTYETKNSMSYFDSTTAITSLDVVQIAGAGTFSNTGNTTIRLYGVS